jgi:hypothetical protein
MWVTSSDDTAHLVSLIVTRSAVNYHQVTVSVTGPQGTDAISAPLAPMVTALWPGLPDESDGNLWFTLDNGDVLKAYYATAMNVALSEITINVQCKDY